MSKVIDQYKDHFLHFKKTGEVYNNTVAAFLENNFAVLIDTPDGAVFEAIPIVQGWLKENLDPDIWGSREKVEAYQYYKGIGR
jgi:hypothetical protein